VAETTPAIEIETQFNGQIKVSHRDEKLILELCDDSKLIFRLDEWERVVGEIRDCLSEALPQRDKTETQVPPILTACFLIRGSLSAIDRQCRQLIEVGQAPEILQKLTAALQNVEDAESRMLHAIGLAMPDFQHEHEPEKQEKTSG